jgi:hypothetical protein
MIVADFSPSGGRDYIATGTADNPDAPFDFRTMIIGVHWPCPNQAVSLLRWYSTY